MKKGLDRRTFLRNVGLAATGALMGCSKVLPEVAALTKNKNNLSSDSNDDLISPLNKIPKWKGFNISDYFQPDPGYVGTNTPEELFKFVADWGFDFIRMPVAYPTYLKLTPKQQYINADDVYKIDENRANEIEKT